MDSMEIKRCRCVNIDWLEVYCLESAQEYPCNADYFRERGYFVKERDYGTRTYREMFTIEDAEGHPWIEVRRNPASGDSSFVGLVPESCHLRLVNQQCYVTDCVSRLREFMLKHNYLFQRIYRIDICYDFIKFDAGDLPEKFAHRYITKKYRKINQGRLAVHGMDEWQDFVWESLSWGSKSSMVSTKMYNKSKELKANGNKKPYIPYAWFMAGLVDSPVDCMVIDDKGKKTYPDVWRIEFSLSAQARDWLVIESQDGKRVKKKAIPHHLDMFDAPDKLWQRFQDLSFHYFRFKYFEEGQRKDRCRDKIIFYWDRGREFCKLDTVPSNSKPDHNDELLRRRLWHYREFHIDPKIRKAIDILLEQISHDETRRFTPHQLSVEVEALRRAIAIRQGWREETVHETVERVKELLINDLIF